MAKVLVYNFSGELDEIQHLFPNERLARIAAIVQQCGGDVTVVDRANFRDLLELGREFMIVLGELGFHDWGELYRAALQKEADHLLSRNFDLVFMNLWHGTGFKFSVDLLRILKQRSPSLAVYGIGQKVDWFEGHILELTGDDLSGLVTGLGYDAIAAITRGEMMGSMSNTIFRRNGEICVAPREVLNVDDFPDPIYDAKTYLNIDQKVPIHHISLSNLACANRCVYCVRPENYGRKVLRRSIARAVAEVQTLVLDRNVRHFRIEDSTPPAGSLTAFAQAILDAGLEGRVHFSSFCRVDVGRAEDFELMKRAGFLSLFFGIESLDDGVLQGLRKGTDYEMICSTLQAAHNAGLYTVGSFIFPVPGETRESMATTLERIGVVRPHLDSALVLPAGVYPPTEWGRNPEKYGIKLREDYIAAGIIYPVKFLVPMEHWKPFPFTYGLVGKSAEETGSDDIVRLQKEFTQELRQKHKLPPVPDYYALMAHMVGRDADQLAAELIDSTMSRDYEAIRGLLMVA